MAKVLLRAAVVGTLLAVGASAVHAQTSSINPNPASPYIQVTLREQLQKGLKCRRPSDFAFVDHVADLVEQGKLPLNLVNICFDWSRQRNSHIPIVYFERSLIMLAAQKGFSLD
jgi:hypothetical protein